MMVNHNTYTNYMAKKTFDYTLDLIEKYKDDAEVSNRVKELGFDETFLKDIRHASEHMKILKDNKTGLYEQHEGFLIFHILMSIQFLLMISHYIRIGHTIEFIETT